jgi:hypothetical protein
MNSTSRWIECCVALAVLALICAGPAVAQIPELSYLPIDEPTEVGGTILEPGIYVIRVVPNLGSRAFVQVMDEHQERVLATVLSVPHPLEPGEKLENTKYVFLPATGEHPRLLRSWFAPGSSSGGGHDFVHTERATAPQTLVARAEPVDPIEEELNLAEAPRVTEAQTDVTIIADADRFDEREPITGQQAVNDPRPSMTGGDSLELPRTAGRAPVLAVLGLLLIGAATGIRSLRST